MSKLTPFHLAVPVYDLNETRSFYRDVLGCEEGRSSDHWVDFNLFGHQFVIHLKPKDEQPKTYHNPVDGHDVPVPHFGVVLEMNAWEHLAEDLKAKGIDFIIEPYTRFKGQVGEQATMFFKDPSGNALEFKAFADMSQVFAK
ncbi:MAG: VOC family protein [Marinoscillum sp.]